MWSFAFCVLSSSCLGAALPCQDNNGADGLLIEGIVREVGRIQPHGVQRVRVSCLAEGSSAAELCVSQTDSRGRFSLRLSRSQAEAFPSLAIEADLRGWVQRSGFLWRPGDTFHVIYMAPLIQTRSEWRVPSWAVPYSAIQPDLEMLGYSARPVSMRGGTVRLPMVLGELNEFTFRVLGRKVDSLRVWCDGRAEKLIIGAPEGLALESWPKGDGKYPAYAHLGLSGLPEVSLAPEQGPGVPLLAGDDCLLVFDSQSARVLRPGRGWGPKRNVAHVVVEVRVDGRKPVSQGLAVRVLCVDGSDAAPSGLINSWIEYARAGLSPLDDNGCLHLKLLCLDCTYELTLMNNRQAGEGPADWSGDSSCQKRISMLNIGGAGPIGVRFDVASSVVHRTRSHVACK